MINRMKRFADYASGKIKCELVLDNVNVVNVLNGTITHSKVGISEGRIVGVGDYVGETTIDLNNQYLVPGLIDAHIHIESTLTTPSQLSRVIVPRGTTTIVTDPHEIANVSGIKGIEYMIEDSKGLPLNTLFTLPSCVPATEFEHSGATLTANDLEPLLKHEEIIGLGEMMNFPGVINGNEEVLEKLHLSRNIPIDGHGPTLSGKALNAYRINGVLTDHECSSPEEMLEKIGLGMYIAIREGSAVKDLDVLYPAINEYTKSFSMFCTDDKHAHELLTIGHIDHIIQKAIKKGLDPITAIQMATINPSRCYGLKDLGAIAPGYVADLVVVDNLNNFNVKQVFKDGKLVAKDHRALFDKESNTPDFIKDTIKLNPIKSNIFDMYLDHDVVNVIGVIHKSLVTELLEEKIELEYGKYNYSNEDIQKIAVIERHGHSSNVGLGLIKGLHIKGGAIATSIAHDSHNIIVAGDSDELMAKAVNELIKIKGGIVVVANEDIETFPLPIGGLMTDLSMEEIAIKTDDIKSFARKKLSIPYNSEPFMTLSFMALPVIPEVKITDQGLFNVNTQQFISLEVEREA